MKRGEIWLVNLDPTIGAEIQKTRPVVIVSDDEIGVLPLKVVVPITSWKENYNEVPWMTHIVPTPENGLSRESAADAFQLRSISHDRFVRQFGILSSDNMAELVECLAVVLKID